MKQRIVAVIPVRKGSQRVKEKSIRPFANTNLLELKINNLKECRYFDNIIVNTDSETAIEIAKKLDVEYHMRDPYFASSICSASDFFYNLAEATDCDIFCYTPVTSPFIKPETIDDCIETFLKNISTHDSLGTVTLQKHHMWKDGKPLNYELNNQPNSQDLPEIYSLNFGCCLAKRETILEHKNVLGIKPMLHILKDIEVIDIDTPLDFFIAEQIYIRKFIEKNSLL